MKLFVIYAIWSDPEFVSFLRDDVEREIAAMALEANGDEDEQEVESQPAPKKKVELAF